MSLTIEFNKPTVKNTLDWQLSQEINVKNDQGAVIAKAEIEIITMNKHRGAEETFNLLDASENTDWEIPLHLYFKKHNLAADIAEKLQVTPDTKAKSHILLEAISVLPAQRKQGVARFLLQEIAKHYAKAQSISVLSMPMKLFLDSDNCETEVNSQYYHSLDLANETMANDQLMSFFTEVGFIDIRLDDSALDEPLPYKILVASPATILS